jgi:5-methyltetrahydropteroyltriglutamate--homocysteine methyltransferase
MAASPFRADHVGSLLRPPELLEARAQFSEGKIDDGQLRDVEDASVLKALDLQRKAGIDVFTDGEYRRTAWSAAAAGAIEGLVPVQGSPIRRIFAEWRGPDPEEINQSIARAQSMVASEKVRKVRRFVAQDAAILKQNAGPGRSRWGPMSMVGGCTNLSQRQGLPHHVLLGRRPGSHD